MKDRVPLHIITGFLGAGKTTTILSLFEMLGADERVAVVVNERGEVGLDGAVLDGNRPGLEIREVAGGCICCTAGAAMDQALEELLEIVKPDRIIIEPSGVAKPGDIIDLVLGSKVSRGLDFRPVIGLVDPELFLEPSFMDMPLYRDQVESTDILVANRCDLVAEETVTAFEQGAAGLFPPKAAVLHTSFGRLPAWVLEPLKDEAKRVRRPIGLDLAMPAQGHQMFQEAGFVWEPEVVFSKAGLEELLGRWAGSFGAKNENAVQRFKGIFHTDRGWRLMELAMGSMHQREIQHRRDSRCQVIYSEGGGDADREYQRELQGAIINKD